MAVRAVTTSGYVFCGHAFSHDYFGFYRIMLLALTFKRTEHHLRRIAKIFGVQDTRVRNSRKKKKIPEEIKSALNSKECATKCKKIQYTRSRSVR